MTPMDPNRRGVLAISAGMASFVANDTLVKYVSESMPASQLIFIRGVMATLLLVAISQSLGGGGRWRDLGDRRVMLRAVLDAFGTVTYLVSLFHMPLANATAINMATPIVITVLAVLFFGEQVRAPRWIAIAVGFTGVMLVVQPSGSEFNAYALLCLLGTVLQASRDFATRLIDRAIPSLLITLSTAILVTIFAVVWSVFEPWQAVNATQLALLAAASVFLSGGYYFVTVAMRAGEMSVIAPFRYSGLLFALVLGYAVWGAIPNSVASAGIALLVGAGVFMLHGQRRA
jgi:drug/metabolite transporter (DMT)-like permease